MLENEGRNLLSISLFSLFTIFLEGGGLGRFGILGSNHGGARDELLVWLYAEEITIVNASKDNSLNYNQEP